MSEVRCVLSRALGKNRGICTEPILPIRRIRTLRRAPETPGGPLALKDVLILVLFLILASGSENMNDRFF